MPSTAYPALNDYAPSWADISVTLTVSGGEALETADIAAASWSSSVEVGEMRGASGGRPMARTSGDVSYEASITLYRSGYRKLQKALAAVAPTRGNQKLIGHAPFDVLIQHTPIGESEIYVTKIKGCRLLGASDDMAEGNEADKIEVTLNPMEIVQIIDGEEIVLI
jgi:hypothetical protein